MGITPKIRQTLTANGALLLLMLMALFIRIAVVLTREMIGGDENVYSHMADNLARGNGPLDMLGGPSTMFMPLLPLLMAGLSFLLGDVVQSGYVLEVLAGCLLLVPAYLLARDMAGSRAGLFTAALLAVLPLAVAFSSRIYTENLYALFIMTAAWFAWKGLNRGSPRQAAGVGIFLGLAYLTNPATVFFLAAAWVFLLGAALRRKGQRAGYLKSAAVITVVFAVFALPFVVYLHGELGKWTYTGKNAYGNISAAASNLRLVTPEYEKEALALTEDGREVLDLARYDDSTDPITFLVTNPRLGLKVLARNMSIFYREELPRVLPLWLLPILGLGLFGRPWDRRRFAAIGFTMVMLAPLAVVFTIDYRARFFSPYMPFVMIWVALGWLRLEEWGQQTAEVIRNSSTRKRLIRWLPLALTVLVLTPLALQTAFEALKENYRTEFRDAGEWIRANAGRDRLVMDREFTAAYYSGGTAVLFPYADYRQTTRYARYKGVDYMVVGKQALTDWRPDLAGVMDREGAHPDWRLVHTEHPGTSREVLIFELLEEGSA